MSKLADRVTKASTAPVREVTSNVADTLPVETAPSTGTSLAPLTSTALVPVGNTTIGQPITVPVPNIIDFSVIRQQAMARQPEKFTVDGIEDDEGPRINLKDLAHTRSDVFHVSPSVLHVEDGWNSRDLSSPKLKASLKTLAENIAVNGVLQPLEVTKKDGRYIILDGHRRYYATLMAIANGAVIETVKCIAPSKSVKPEHHYLSQILRNEGVEFNAIEQGDVIAKLVDVGMSEEMIAQKITKPVSKVRDLLELRGTPQQVREWVSHGKLSATVALATWRANPEKKALRLMAKMVETADAENGGKVNTKIVNAVTGKVAKMPKPLREVNTFLSTADIRHDETNNKTLLILNTEQFRKLEEMGLFKKVEDESAQAEGGETAQDDAAEQAA